MAGISRSHFYEIKEALEKYGREGLVPAPRRAPRMPNQTPSEVEVRVLTQEYPTTSYVKLADQLKLIGVPVSAGAVRGMWARRGLLTRFQRLLWVEREAGAGVPLERVLTDNGREFCGRPLAHPYELYCAVQQLEQRTTKVRSPQTNGFCERRFHRTLKEEFFAVALRRKFYGSVQELQADLDEYLRFYNEARSHQGYRTQGRTPWAGVSGRGADDERGRRGAGGGVRN